MADKLAAELGDLPLAAAQAAGYLEQTGLPSSDYLRRLRSHRAGLLADGEVLDYQGRVDTTWEISLERLRAVSPAAVALLEISAFLAPEPIPLSLFTEHPDLLDEPLRSVADDPDALADAVGAMVGFSLARRSRDGYQVHRLVQAVIRNRMPPSHTRPLGRRRWRCWRRPTRAIRRTRLVGGRMHAWRRTSSRPDLRVTTTRRCGSSCSG